MFLPKFYIYTILIPHKSNIINGDILSFVEFLWFVCLFNPITSNTGYNIMFFEEVNLYLEGAPICWIVVMNGNQFEYKLPHSCLLIFRLHLKDKFFKNFEINSAWNYHIKDALIPLRLSCLDDFIYICTKTFIWPIWMCVPRKLHPKGNDYHLMCCGETKIIYRWELVEGRYQPTDLVIS